MIDSTKGPVPAWKRYGAIALMALVVLGAAYLIWTKELRHKASGASSAPPAASSQAAPSSSQSHSATTPTTVGLPLSLRDPFGS